VVKFTEERSKGKKKKRGRSGKNISGNLSSGKDRSYVDMSIDEKKGGLTSIHTLGVLGKHPRKAREGGKGDLKIPTKKSKDK